MRKFVVGLILLIIAGAVVFYFGWIQIQLPANTYGVAFTKTNGWDEHVAIPGRFDWRWQRLLPTNFVLYRFHLTPQSADVNSSGELPSGKLYAQYLEGAPDFSFTLELTVSYELKPSALPSLARAGTTSQPALQTWYKDFQSRLVAEASRELTTTVADLATPPTPAKSGAGTDFSVEAVAARLLKGLNDAFPDVTITSVLPIKFSLPDMALYAKARSTYFAVLDSKQNAIERAVNAAATQQLNKSDQLALLRQYGELLTQYPILLKYLALEQGKSLSSVDLSDIQIPNTGNASAGSAKTAPRNSSSP